MNIEFKFNIGDMVVAKNAVEEMKFTSRSGGGCTYPRALYISQRVMTECCGGIQLTYCLSGIGEQMPEGNLMLLSDVNLEECLLQGLIKESEIRKKSYQKEESKGSKCQKGISCSCQM